MWGGELGLWSIDWSEREEIGKWGIKLRERFRTFWIRILWSGSSSVAKAALEKRHAVRLSPFSLQPFALPSSSSPPTPLTISATHFSSVSPKSPLSSMASPTSTPWWLIPFLPRDVFFFFLFNCFILFLYVCWDCGVGGGSYRWSWGYGWRWWDGQFVLRTCRRYSRNWWGHELCWDVEVRILWHFNLAELGFDTCVYCLWQDK